MRRRILSTLAAGGMLLALAAPASAAKPPALKVKLIEFEVQPASDYIAKGKTQIVAKNAGTEQHELVIVRGDDAAALPTDADGAVDESQIPEADKMGEIPEFKPDKTKKKVFKLSPGKYVLFCNVVDEEDDGTTVSHFAEGMHTVIDAS